MEMDARSFTAFTARAIAALLLLCAPSSKLHAQSVMRFDRPSQTWVGNAVQEGGYLFSSPLAPGGVNGGGMNFWNPPPGTNNSEYGSYTLPYDGTQYAQPFTDSQPVLTQSNSAPFTLQSFDWAPYGAGLGLYTNYFYLTGYYAGGGTVSTQFDFLRTVVQGQIGDFQTCTLNSSWTNLTQVVMHNDIVNYGNFLGFSIDNITVVPEPAALTLVLLGVIGLMFTCRRTSRHRHP